MTPYFYMRLELKKKKSITQIVVRNNLIITSNEKVRNKVSFTVRMMRHLLRLFLLLDQTVSFYIEFSRVYHE
jgi:hypothetical protein